MSDALLAAIIGLAGAVVGAAISGFITYKATMQATKNQIRANEQALKEQKEQAARDLLIESLQRDSQSIGLAALRLSYEKLPQYEPYRELVLLSLVQAAIFSSSDRARAMVYSVLRDNYHDYRPEIDKVIASLENSFNQVERFQQGDKELNLELGNRRLSALRKVLEEPTEPTPPSAL